MYSATDLIQVFKVLSIACDFDQDAMVVLKGPKGSQIKGVYDKASNSFSWEYSIKRKGVHLTCKMTENCELIDSNKKKFKKVRYDPWLQAWYVDEMPNFTHRLYELFK